MHRAAAAESYTVVCLGVVIVAIIFYQTFLAPPSLRAHLSSLRTHIVEADFGQCKDSGSWLNNCCFVLLLCYIKHTTHVRVCDFFFKRWFHIRLSALSLVLISLIYYCFS